MSEYRPQVNMSSVYRAKRILDNTYEWVMLDRMKIGSIEPSQVGLDNASKLYCKMLARADVCKRTAGVFAQDRVLREAFLASVRNDRSKARKEMEEAIKRAGKQLW